VLRKPDGGANFDATFSAIIESDVNDEHHVTKILTLTLTGGRNICLERRRVSVSLTNKGPPTCNRTNACLPSLGVLTMQG
jgi:hypothetical protein